MSSTPLAHGQPPKKENRRLRPRRRIDEITYARFGPGNGGILLNLSEGGASFQGVGVVGRDQLIRLNFKLPGMSYQIEATGEVVWSNDSGKGGGLRFLDLTEETRKRVKEWIANDASSAGSFAKQVTTHSGAASRLGTSDRAPVESLPGLDGEDQPKNAPVGPGLQASQPLPIPSLSPEAATVPNKVGTPARMTPRCPGA